jgi:hypothetical protein
MDGDVIPDGGEIASGVIGLTRDTRVGAEVGLATGVGPVGTGVHLLRARPAPGGDLMRDAWFSFLFLPLVPLGTWVLTADRPGPLWTLRSVKAPTPVRSIATLGVWFGTAILTFMPGYVAVTFFMGSKVLELAGLFGTAGLVIGLLAWLDETRPRVLLGQVVALLRRRAQPRTPAGSPETRKAVA